VGFTVFLSGLLKKKTGVFC